MPRKPNTRPTSIYWLYDMRPETIAAGWHEGYPFYCGKTVLKVKDRFIKHRSDARRYPHTEIAKRIAECGENISVVTMEIVQPNQGWSEREKYWIHTLRTLYPGAVNITAGGQGMPGHIPTEATRAKRSASLKGRIFSDEHRANIGKASANRSPEVRAKIGASQRGRIASPETRAKLSIAGRGKKRSDETRARMSAALKRRSPEVYEFARKPKSPETRAKISASRIGIRPSVEVRAKLSAAAKRRCARSAEERLQKDKTDACE